MYDPLQASEPSKSSSTVNDKHKDDNNDNFSGLQATLPSQSHFSPPATPSKSKTSSRPGPWQGQQFRQPAQFSEQKQNQPSFLPISNNSAGYKSPLAPRPPLPGQAPRPVSPSQYQQHHQQQYIQSPLHSDPSRATPYSPNTPNAWATSSSSSASTSMPSSSSVSDIRYSAPGPLPVPSPIGFASPKRGTSPGLPRSPVAEHPQKPTVSQSFKQNDNISGQAQQPPRERAPPFLRISIHGIDRAKKELGIKMNAQTNIPTYHRHTSSLFSRTFAEFSSLHIALSANHPETILPAIPLPQTSATSEEEEDRFLKTVFQRFIDRICRDKSVVLDDELRGFVEADFGYTPITRAKKLKSTSGFLSRSTSKPVLSENGEPDFLLTSKIHSAILEASLVDTTRFLEKSLKASTATASSYADLSSNLTSFSTTETHPPLSNGLKQLAEAMRTIAELEIGQSNATALMLGDPFAYEAVEARSAKDALLQRQYCQEDLHNTIKATIAKRRNVEKLRGGSNIKSERVNEALDELDEAQKSEQNLQSRVQAISTHLRPALQTHLRAMNDDMLSILLHHARTQSAYESRKLLVYEGVYNKVRNIPEKGSADAVYYHQPQTQVSLPATGSIALPNTNGISQTPLPSAMTIRDDSDKVVPVAHESISSDIQSKFSAREAEIRAHMQAQQIAEQLQRERAIAKQEISRSSSLASSLSSSTSLAVQANSISHNTPASPVQSEATRKVPKVFQVDSAINGVESNHISQSMYAPSVSSGLTAPILRSPPASPTRIRNSALTSAVPQSSAQPAFDPLSSAPVPSRNPILLRQNAATDLKSTPGDGPKVTTMAQSVFLPGKTANAGRLNNPMDDKKRADARKAASLLSGAF